MRDLLLGNLPPNSFIYPYYVAAATLVSLALFLAAYQNPRLFRERVEKFTNAINIFDAIGLGLFAVNGTSIAIQCGFGENGFLAIFVGALTGIGGGLIRDVMVAEIPKVLRKRIYALAAVTGSGVYYLMHCLSLNGTLSMACGIAVTIIIRLLATYFKWTLPRVKG